MSKFRVTVETTGKEKIFDLDEYGNIEDTVAALTEHLNDEIDFQDIICSCCPSGQDYPL